MSVASPNNTLLALLLALKNLKVDLSDIEINGFKRAIDLLQLEPDNWDSIHNDLIAIINRNAPLKENFHNFLTGLEALENGKKADIFPTEGEMAQVFPQHQGIEIRGYNEGKADFSSREINNESREIARKTFEQENPREFSQQNAWLERLEKILMSLFPE